MFITVWLFISPFFSSFLIGVYKQYTQLISIAIAWNFTGILYTGTWLPGYWTFQQIYIRYLTHWWKFRHIHITRMVLRGKSVLLYFNTIWLCPDVYPFSLHLFLVHSVGYTVCWHSHVGFHVYEMYTYSVYDMYTSGFTFPGWLYDHRTFILLQTLHLPVLSLWVKHAELASWNFASPSGNNV